MCRELVAGKHKKYDSKVMTCQAFITAHDGGKATLHSSGVELSFDQGRLAGISLGTDIVGGPVFDYPTLYNDAVQKFGKPTQESTKALQNGYGATWTSHSAIWVGKGVMVSVIEDVLPGSANCLPSRYIPFWKCGEG